MARQSPRRKKVCAATCGLKRQENMKCLADASSGCFVHRLRALRKKSLANQHVRVMSEQYRCCWCRFCCVLQLFLVALLLLVVLLLLVRIADVDCWWCCWCWCSCCCFAFAVIQALAGVVAGAAAVAVPVGYAGLVDSRYFGTILGPSNQFLISPSVLWRTEGGHQAFHCQPVLGPSSVFGTLQYLTRQGVSCEGRLAKKSPQKSFFAQTSGGPYWSLKMPIFH